MCYNISHTNLMRGTEGLLNLALSAWIVLTFEEEFFQLFIMLTFKE